MSDLFKNPIAILSVLFLTSACADNGRLVADELNELDVEPGNTQVRGGASSVSSTATGGSAAESTPEAAGGSLGVGGTSAMTSTVSNSPYTIIDPTAATSACRIDTLEWKGNRTIQGNPAAVYCSKVLKYDYRIEETEAGQAGICVFPDKTECGEWALFRGECGREFTRCAVDGYQVLAVQSEFGPDGFACCFPSGKVCFDLDYAEGDCTP